MSTDDQSVRPLDSAVTYLASRTLRCYGSAWSIIIFNIAGTMSIIL